MEELFKGIDEYEKEFIGVKENSKETEYIPFFLTSESDILFMVYNNIIKY